MRQFRFGIIMTCLLLLPALSGNAALPAGQDSGDGIFGISLGYLTGNTLYHISSYDATGGVESELEFPLKTPLFSVAGGYIGRDRKGREEFRVTFQWITNIGDGSGQMKDSDWFTDSVDISLVGATHQGLDIYSTSDITLRANILDLRGSYNAWRSKEVSIGPFGGILYQRFEYDASNANQVGYGPYAPVYTGFILGPVLTYDVTYVIPYAGIHAALLALRNFTAVAELGFSPIVSASDEDDHLLRGKVAKGSTTGTAFLATLSAQWDLKNEDSILLQGQYLKIDTSGTQTQTWYRAEGSIPAGTVVTGINDKITSQQTSVNILFSHRF
jgi:outer membrane protease